MHWGDPRAKLGGAEPGGGGGCPGILQPHWDRGCSGGVSPAWPSLAPPPGVPSPRLWGLGRCSPGTPHGGGWKGPTGCGGPWGGGSHGISPGTGAGGDPGGCLTGGGLMQAAGSPGVWRDLGTPLGGWAMGRHQWDVWGALRGSVGVPWEQRVGSPQGTWVSSWGACAPQSPQRCPHGGFRGSPRGPYVSVGDPLWGGGGRRGPIGLPRGRCGGSAGVP